MEEDKNLSDVEKAIKAKELNDQITKEINSLKPFEEELKTYINGTADFFYEHIIREKNFYTQFGAMYYKLKVEAEGKWLGLAFNCLAEIQEKKLFDMQCLWRAEKITIPNIEACVDFMSYQHDVLNCPFLDPITDDEIELYHQYIKSSNFEVVGSFEKALLSNFQQIREAYNSDNEDSWCQVPEWYDFHNGRTGKGIYMTFPDVRGEKELFYQLIAIEKEKVIKEEKAKEAIKEQPITPILPRPKPDLEWHTLTDTINFFVTSFEDKETQRIYKKHTEMFGFLSERDYDYDEIISILSQHCEVWPIEAHYDWRQALNNSLASYTKSKITEALPLAYEQYKMYKEMGITFEKSSIHDNDFIVDLIKQRILSGRKYDNEPEDFDF